MNKSLSVLKKVLGVVFPILFIGLIFYKLNFKDFVDNITKLKWEYLLIFIPVYIFNQYLKGMRWKILVNNKGFSAINSFFIFSIGNALNICLPYRFGDFWKAYKTGENINISKTEVLGTAVSERSLDFISILLLLIFITYRYLKTDLTLRLINNAVISLSVLFVAILLAIFLNVFKFKILNDFVKGIKSVGNFYRLAQCFTITIVTRIIECILVYILLLGAGLKIAISATLFVIVFNALAGMIPSVSTYIGAYQYSYILALGIFGIDKSMSLSIVIIYQFITLLILGIISLIYI